MDLSNNYVKFTLNFGLLFNFSVLIFKFLSKAITVKCKNAYFKSCRNKDKNVISPHFKQHFKQCERKKTKAIQFESIA